MARVTTQLINEATVGDGVDPVQAQKLALQVDTKVVSVAVLLTATPSNNGSKVKMFVATSPVDTTAAIAARDLDRQAYIREFNWPLEHGKKVHIITTPRIVQGAYLYVWFELPKVTAPGTLSAWAVEV